MLELEVDSSLHINFESTSSSAGITFIVEKRQQVLYAQKSSIFFAATVLRI